MSHKIYNFIRSRYKIQIQNTNLHEPVYIKDSFLRMDGKQKKKVKAIKGKNIQVFAFSLHLESV